MLYGNESSAILHQDLGDGLSYDILGDGLSYDIHHHNLGGGAIDFNPTPKDDPFRIKLDWTKF